MEAHLQKSVNIRSLPNDPNIYNQANQQLLEELNTDQNLENQLLSDIKKQEKSLQQDIAYNRLMEDRKLDIAQPANPLTNPRNNNTDDNDIPANIMAQQQSVNMPQQQPQQPQLINIETYDNITTSNTKNNNKRIQDDDDDLIEESSESYFNSLLNYITKIYKEFFYTIVFFYIFNMIEVDLIVSASLSSLIKINLLKYTKYIGAIVFAILYIIIKKYII